MFELGVFLICVFCSVSLMAKMIYNWIDIYFIRKDKI